MIDARSEAETHFRRRRISLRLRLCSLRKGCSSLAHRRRKLRNPRLFQPSMR